MGRQSAVQSWSGEWVNCHIIRNATAVSSAANSRFDVVSLRPTEIFDAPERRDDTGEADDRGETQVDVAVRAVAQRAHDRRRDDHGQRGPLGDDRRDAEADDHRRHHDDPAADAEQPGEDAGQEPDDRRGRSRSGSTRSARPPASLLSKSSRTAVASSTTANANPTARCGRRCRMCVPIDGAHHGARARAARRPASRPCPRARS